MYIFQNVRILYSTIAVKIATPFKEVNGIFYLKMAVFYATTTFRKHNAREVLTLQQQGNAGGFAARPRPAVFL